MVLLLAGSALGGIVSAMVRALFIMLGLVTSTRMERDGLVLIDFGPVNQLMVMLAQVHCGRLTLVD